MAVVVLFILESRQVLNPWWHV